MIELLREQTYHSNLVAGMSTLLAANLASPPMSERHSRGSSVKSFESEPHAGHTGKQQCRETFSSLPSGSHILNYNRSLHSVARSTHPVAGNYQESFVAEPRVSQLGNYEESVPFQTRVTCSVNSRESYPSQPCSSYPGHYEESFSIESHSSHLGNYDELFHRSESHVHAGCADEVFSSTLPRRTPARATVDPSVMSSLLDRMTGLERLYTEQAASASNITSAMMQVGSVTVDTELKCLITYSGTELKCLITNSDTELK